VLLLNTKKLSAFLLMFMLYGCVWGPTKKSRVVYVNCEDQILALKIKYAKQVKRWRDRARECETIDSTNWDEDTK